MAFGGFSREGLGFLTTLGSKDKAWFDANRAVYEREVVAPTKAFVTALGDVLVDRVSSGPRRAPSTRDSWRVPAGRIERREAGCVSLPQLEARDRVGGILLRPRPCDGPGRPRLGPEEAPAL